MRSLVPIFFLSGASSLMYQVVWQRLLTLHYGVGSVSIALIVSVYMLGLGLGALFGGRAAERMESPLRGYCVVEFAIAGFGALSLPLLALIGRFTAGSPHVVSSLAMFAFLLIPTLAMGATLPLLVKAMNRVRGDFFQSVSVLYFINTLGASFGALVTAYGLITFGGLDVALGTAVAINIGLGLSVLALARGSAGAAPAVPARPAEAAEIRLGARVYPLVFVSGFVAIAYELVWFRIIGVLNKASPYAFATSLAVYLLGIALGSFAVELLLRRRPALTRVRLYFGLQLATGLSVVASMLLFLQLTGSGPLGALAQRSFEQVLHPPSWQLGDLAGVFVWPLFFQLVPTMLIGAGFPLLAQLALSRPDREADTVGRVYFVNTLGNLAGGVICGFLLLALFGTEWTLAGLAMANIALLLLAPAAAVPTPLRLGALVAGVLAILALTPASGEIYRRLHPQPTDGFTRYMEEGRDGVVATFERGPVVVNYINGLLHGGRPEASFIVETMEAMAVAPSSKNVLVIGFGTGTITEVVLRNPEVERVTLVELNRTLMTNLRKMQVFRDILDDPRLEIVFDDGRRHLIREDTHYDLVLIDPLRSTTAYSNNLYSLEFFELVGSRLEECGIFMAWSDNADSVPRTVATAFDHAAYYELGAGENFVLGSGCAFSRTGGNVRRLLEVTPPQERMSVERWFLPLQARLDRSGLLEATSGAPLNRDRRPASEYYLGRRRLPTP